MNDAPPARALPLIAPYDPPAEDEIAPSRAGWHLVADRAALLIHDMQGYFLSVFPPHSEPMASARRAIANLASKARKRHVPVFYTAQSGNQDPRDRGLQADFWGPGMQAIADHQEIVADLAPHADDFVLVKHRYSAFQRTNLEALMRARGRDQLIVTGVYGHIGCMLTAAEAFQRDIQPFIVADALGDFSRERHLHAVSYVTERCGVALSAKQAMEALR